MERNQALLLAIVAGGVIGCQAPINRALGSHVGNMQAALVNFLVGGTVVLVIVMFNGGLSGIASDPVRWHYMGGLFGVDKRPLTLEHLAGICLALAGVFVFARA